MSAKILLTLCVVVLTVAAAASAIWLSIRARKEPNATLSHVIQALMALSVTGFVHLLVQLAEMPP